MSTITSAAYRQLQYLNATIVTPRTIFNGSLTLLLMGYAQQPMQAASTEGTSLQRSSAATLLNHQPTQPLSTQNLPTQPADLPLPRPPSPLTQPPPSAPTLSPSNPTKVELSAQPLLPVGFMMGTRTVIETVPVRGAEDGTQAIDFQNWLLPFDDVLKALGFRSRSLDNGQLELRSPAAVLQIDPAQLKTDPELGAVLSIQDIETLLKIPARFDINEYAVVFKPPWLNQTLPTQRFRRQAAPISLEGLPKVKPPNFSLTGIEAELGFSGTKRDSVSRGEFTGVGALPGGSWFVRTIQEDLGNSKTLELDEAQYLRQTPSSDLVVGSQPTFWNSPTTSELWGITLIKRWDFQPPTTISSLGSGFNPQERLQSNRVDRDIVGRAAPGTLVRLVTDIGRQIVGEALVDSSGIYRFSNVTTSFIDINGFRGATGYRVLLYPNGQLSAAPEIRPATFDTLPGQLPKGAAALILSTGANRNRIDNQFLGEFPSFKAGLGYRTGVTDSLTLGTGIIYDQAVYGLAEIFLQPSNVPLKFSAAALINPFEQIRYDASLSYRPNSKLSLNLDADEFSERFNLLWQALPILNFNFNGNTQEKALGLGVGFNHSLGIGSISLYGNIDTNGNLRWNARLYQGRFTLTHLGNEVATTSELTYDFSRYNFSNYSYNGLFLRHDTGEGNFLTTLGWRYTSVQTNSTRRPLWTLDLGYGIGSSGNGVVASVRTYIIPGIAIQAQFQGISLASNDYIFSLTISPSLFLQPRVRPGDDEIERLRSEGGLVLEAFLDNNMNGQRDKGEKIYTDDPDTLFLLNNQPFQRFSRFNANTSRNGISVRLVPNDYLLTLDPSGFPPGWKTNETAYAVEVRPGVFTRLQIPFVPSYTVSGIVQDSEGKAVAGVRVEAISMVQSGKRGFSITNSAGIFYLEELERGTYTFLVNGKPTQPATIEINQDSEALQELNLRISN